MRTPTKTATATATNAPAVATIPSSGLERRNRLWLIHASVTAGTARLTVAQDQNADGDELDTGEILWQATVVAGAPTVIAFPAGLEAPKPGTAVHVSLTAAGASNVGDVNVVYTPE